MEKENVLGTEPIAPLLFRLGIPAICAQLIVLAYNVIDRIYLGRIENSDIALAALGISVPICILIFALIAWLGRGGAPLASISLGAKDRDNADKIISNCFSFLLCAAFLCTLSVHFFARDMLSLFGAHGEVLEVSINYLRVYNIGTPFLFIGLGLSFFINAQGFTKIAMMAPVLGAVANFTLNPVFIFYFDLGIVGAAIATVIAQAISFVWVLCFFMSKKTLLKIKLSYMIPKPEITRKVLSLGSAPAFMTGSEGLVLIAFNVQLLHFVNVSAVSSMTIVKSIFLLILFPILGIMNGAQPIVSYNYGAEKLHRVRETLVLLFKINFSFSFVVTSLVVLFPEFFVGLFTNDEAIIGSTVKILNVYILGTYFLGLMITCQETYTALGEGMRGFFFAFLRKGILLIPLIFLLPMTGIENKLFAIVVAEPISDISSSIIACVCFFYFARRKLGLFKTTD